MGSTLTLGGGDTQEMLLFYIGRTLFINLRYARAPLPEGREAKTGLDDYFRFYNTQRPHQALGYRTPAEVFNEDSVSNKRAQERRGSPKRALVDLVKTAGLSLNNAPILSY